MTVVAFAGQDITSERRAEFIEQMAASFDRYVADCGLEPDATAIVLGGLKQRPRCSWSIRGASEDGATAFLALSAMVLTKECVNPDE